MRRVLYIIGRIIFEAVFAVIMIISVGLILLILANVFIDALKAAP